jgi:hypothetical protein
VFYDFIHYILIQEAVFTATLSAALRNFFSLLVIFEHLEADISTLFSVRPEHCLTTLLVKIKMLTSTFGTEEAP